MRYYLLALIVIVCQLLSAQTNRDLILQNAKYFNTESETFEVANILIQDGIISKIDKEEIALDDIQVIDASDFFTIPGLVDAHIHLFQSGGIYTRPDAVDLTHIKPYNEEIQFLKDNAGDLLKRYLSAGITSVVDIGGPIYNYTIRDQFKDNPDYPNLYITGPLVSTYQPPAFNIEDAPIIKVNDEQEAIDLVKKQLPFTPDFIKIWGIPVPGVTSDEMFKIMVAAAQESKRNGLRVFVHATQLNTAKLAIKAGADVLVHSVRDAGGWVDEEFVQMLKDSNVVYIPTLIVGSNYSRAFAGAFEPTEEDFAISNPLILGEIFDVHHLKDIPTFQRAKNNYENALENYRHLDSTTTINHSLLKKNGVIIATGTDAGNIGTLHASSYYDEIKAMKKVGMNNLDILIASTLNGAKTVGQEKVFGSITVGKRADLVLLKSNPLDDIEHIKDVELIIKSGKLHKADEIIEMSPAMLAQMQLNAYNAGDIEAFLVPYSDNVAIYDFPEELSYSGKQTMRNGYANFFKQNPDLHCELINRIVNGDTVIDHERITGIEGMEAFDAIAIYKIENNKIAKVYFMR